MAGLCTCRNPPLGGKKKLAKASIEGNSTFSPFSIVFQAQTLAPVRLPISLPLQARREDIQTRICRELPSWPWTCLSKIKNIASSKQTPPPARSSLKLGFSTHIMGIHISIAIVSTYSVKTISKLLGPIGQIESLLLSHFSAEQ